MTPVLNEYSTREQRGWYLYDVANSVFATSAIALFLPRYVTSLAAAAADSAGFVHPLGIPVFADSFWAYILGLSVFLQVLVLPVVGALADHGRQKREFLAGTAFVGAATAAAMFFLQGTMYLIAGALFIFANVAFGASIVIYNAFLPEVAPPEERDSLSSRGWALGYVAGCVMLVAHLVLLSNAERWGLSTTLAVRVALCSTGIWWALWTVPVILRLRNRGTAHHLNPGSSIIGTAFRQLFGTLRDVRRYPNTMKFLIGYLLYNDAIQTVFSVAALFGARELHLTDSQLTITILISQIVGIGGALSFNELAKRISAKYAVIVSLIIWILLLFYAYEFVHSATEFYIMGGIAGLVMGGSQALSRSIFAQLVPKGKEAEYFSIYEIGDKGTSWIGPPTFGLALQLTGSYRIALLSLLIFFLAGLAVLTQADVRQGELDVLRNV
jgi:UMF1 family MFS transporter